MSKLDLYDRFNMNCVNTEDCSKCKCCDDETGDLVLCALMFGYKQGKADGIDEFVDAITCTPYFTNMQKDAFRIFAEQLKEQK